MGTELRRAQCAKQAKRKSNEQRRIASGSAARRLLRIVGTRESRKRACERPKARRAGVSSTRSEAQCADTEHRAAKGGTVRRCGTTIPNCGTLSAKLTEGLSIPPSRLRRATSLLKKGGITGGITGGFMGGFWAVQFPAIHHYPKGSPVGRSFAARSARNRRSGSPMNKGALQAVRRCKATIVNCGTKQREVSPMRAKEAAQPVGRTKAARSARNRP